MPNISKNLCSILSTSTRSISSLTKNLQHNAQNLSANVGRNRERSNSLTSNPLALVDTKNLPGLDVIRNLNPFHQAQKDFCKSRSYEENIDRVFDICQEFEETSFGTAFRKRLKAFSCISEINDDIKSSRYDRVTEDIPKSSNNKRLSIQKTNTQIRIDPFDTEIVEFQFQSKNSESTTTNTCMCSEVRSVGNLASRPDSASNSAPPSTKSEDKDINYRFENMIINEGDQILSNGNLNDSRVRGSFLSQRRSSFHKFRRTRTPRHSWLKKCFNF